MRIFKCVAILVALFLIASQAVEPIFGIRYTVSQSVPYKLFISRPLSRLTKNRYITFEHPQSSILLAKQIIGIAGDRVTIKGERLHINEQDYGLILNMSKSGMPLHPISEGEIPEGYVFVYAPHEDSFDSRYQEFGLVKVEQLRESLWPIF